MTVLRLKKSPKWTSGQFKIHVSQRQKPKMVITVPKNCIELDDHSSKRGGGRGGHAWGLFGWRNIQETYLKKWKGKIRLVKNPLTGLMNAEDALANGHRGGQVDGNLNAVSWFFVCWILLFDRCSTGNHFHSRQSLMWVRALSQNSIAFANWHFSMEATSLAIAPQIVIWPWKPSLRFHSQTVILSITYNPTRPTLLIEIYSPMRFDSNHFNTKHRKFMVWQFLHKLQLQFLTNGRVTIHRMWCHLRLPSQADCAIFECIFNVKSFVMIFQEWKSK